ncbi:hypothetical protein OPT61_g6522 [Boeremia exigua]|uniref:Uncharacterized protein n=1 Tax=Boeremia exigua TaxID=749465 RepID=A0ACC2I6B3_9PLEO|nr:hypothetical protein OPT61_g6522 [Boeremia exigua]
MPAATCFPAATTKAVQSVLRPAQSRGDLLHSARCQHPGPRTSPSTPMLIGTHTLALEVPASRNLSLGFCVWVTPRSFIPVAIDKAV